jgi:CubicO group peptidase (beta-lactamase class C family)
MANDQRLQNIARNGNLKFADIEYGTNNHFVATQYTSEAVDSPLVSHEKTLAADRRYLIASITKPLVAMAMLKLAAEGEISLSDRIGSVLPEFAKAVYRRITVRHLLTHTSGFPDMLPNNRELRAAHASLDELQQHASKVELEFSTGCDCRYSSVGYLILGAMIQQLTSVSTGEYLRQHFFAPLGMSDSWLGLTHTEADTVLPTLMPCELPIWQPDAEAWGWNSRYWRMLGAPWGGMISSAADLGKFARMMLSDGCSQSGQQIIPEEVILASIRNQLAAIVVEPGYAGSHRPWGFGWRRQWPAHHASFGDFVSDLAYGHWGATGTLFWIDPVSSRYAAILTTTPYEQSQSAIQRMSNLSTVQD